MIDFDSVIERTGTDSMKWDVREGEISMGIADMDFQSAPCVREAVLRKAQFGIYGYADVPQAYYESYQRWWSRRHGWTPDTSSAKPGHSTSALSWPAPEAPWNKR